MSELRGRLLVDGGLRAGRLSIEGGHIARVELDAGSGEVPGSRAAPSGAVEPAARDAPGLPIVAPGLVDLHVHGFGGHEVAGGLAGMARALARAGTTAFQPTLFPGAPERLGREAEAVSRAAADLSAGSARVVGLHLEGPFVNPAAAGALQPDDLALPSVAALRALLGPATGDGRGVRTLTLAPELPGALELIRELARAGVRASLGHSLASAEEARAAARAGAVGATHLYNAMPRFHHRAAGLAGFALAEDALVPEIIGDLVHVGAEALRIALAARGPRSLCLVSDALSAAATGCDRFHTNGREHLVRGGAAWFVPEPDPCPGTDEPPRAGEPELRLGGAVLGQLEAVRGLVRAGVATAAEALTLASEAPARALGLEAELGRLAVGARADVLVLGAADLGLREVWLGGERVATGGG